MRAMRVRGWTGPVLFALVFTMSAPASAQSPAGGRKSQLDTRAIRTTLAEAGIQAPPPQGRRRDSLWNGLLIGAGIGALAGLIPDYYDDCEECHDSLYASIGVGAAIGVAVDLLRSDRRPAPPAAPNSRLRMNVTGGPKAVRIHGALRW